MLFILYLCEKHKLLIRLLFGVVPHLRCFVVFLQFKPFFKSIGHIVAVRNQKLIIMRQFNLTDSLSSEKAGPPLPRRCIWMRMALVILLAVFAVATMQAADYGIRINGYSVWEKNCNDLSGIKGVTGSVKYDPATKTLTLENATITGIGDERCLYSSECEGLRIVLKGSNRIVNNEGVGMEFRSATTICGPGTLDIRTKEKEAILFIYVPLVIEDCEITINSENTGIVGGFISEKSVLTVRNSRVDVNAKNGCVVYFGGIVLEDCAIVQPKGVVFDKGCMSLAIDGEIVKGRLVIGKPNYSISVAGVAVTKDNCNDLSVIDGVSGIVKYDGITRTLTLENATIAPGKSTVGIFNADCNDLTINVIGENSISVALACIWAEKATTISGSGKLNLKSNVQDGIHLQQAPVTIENCSVYAEGTYGIKGVANESGQVVTVRNAYVEAYGKSGSVCQISGLVLDGSYVSAPENAAFDPVLQGIAVDGFLVKTNVVIAPDEKYGIMVNEVNVTSSNCKDLSVIDGVTGKVSFNPKTKVLILDGATIINNKLFGSGIINSACEGLTIWLEGNNRITSDGGALVMDKPTTISGTGKLDLSCRDVYCVSIRGTALTIEDCEVAVKSKWCICGSDAQNNSLTVRDAVVRVEGENGAIINIDALVLEGCGVTEPVGAKFDAALRGVALDGALVKGKVVIGPVTYGVNVAGVALTGKNCGDLSVIPGVEGMASFDPATNTISLGNATITGNVAVNSMIPDLKIMLIGENNFISSDKGICTIGALTVLGPGTLNIKAKNDGIMTVASPVVIDGAKVSINAEMGVAGAKCIVGDADVGDERLVVRKADVEITSVLGAVPAIGDVQLDGCHITEPVGAAFDSAMRALVFEGKPVEKLVIRPDADGIHDITADIPESRRGTFNMQGVKLDVDWDSLPAGIYIVDGVKKVKF